MLHLLNRSIKYLLEGIQACVEIFDLRHIEFHKQKLVEIVLLSKIIAVLLV